MLCLKRELHQISKTIFGQNYISFIGNNKGLQLQWNIMQRQRSHINDKITYHHNEQTNHFLCDYATLSEARLLAACIIHFISMQNFHKKLSFILSLCCVLTNHHIHLTQQFISFVNTLTPPSRISYRHIPWKIQDYQSL